MGGYPTLTTQFVAPSECSSHWTWRKYQDSNADTTTILQDYGVVDYNPITTLCYPHPGGSWSNSLDIGTYSPGICPAGHTTAGLWWDADTTTAMCCESGFTYTGEDKGCTKTYSTSTTVIVVDHDSSSGRTTYTSKVGPGEAIMFAIAVMYRPDDLSLFPENAVPLSFVHSTGDQSSATATAVSSGEAPTASAGASITGISTPTSVASASSIIASPSQTSSSGGLSAGEKAAIAVAVVLASFIAVGIGMFIFFYKRQKKLKKSEEHWKQEVNRVSARFEDKKTAQEAVLAELPATGSRTELEGRILDKPEDTQVAPGQEQGNVGLGGHIV